MKKILLITLSALLSFNVAAEIKPEYKNLAANLKKFNPDLPKIEEIKETELKNIYEVVINKSEIFYTDPTGKFILLGNLLKQENGTYINLTEDKINSLNKIEFSSFNLKNAIVKKYGDGKNKLVTFEDPNCGFCKRLAPELEKLKDVTVYTFIIPILGKNSLDISRQIWCSKDKNSAWHDYMLKGVRPNVSEKDLKSCDTKALQENVMFASKNNIQGTPAIFFENGKSIKGYTNSEHIQSQFK